MQKAPVCADHLRIVLQTCLDTLRGMRDRALLAPGFAGALRRSELVALQVGDFVEVPDELRLVIRMSKTDQEGVGQEIASPPRLPPPPRGSLPRVAGGGRHATV